MFKESIISGFLIGLSCIIYMLNINSVAGPLGFSFGLAMIVLFKLPLYTGKVGYAQNFNFNLIKVLCGNMLGALLLGLSIIFFIPSLLEKLNFIVADIIYSKLYQNFNLFSVFFPSFFCGMLVHLSVEGYKRYYSIIPIVLGVFAFVTCGFYHCIADTFYLTFINVNFENILRATIYLTIAICGNSLGAITINEIIKNKEG